MAATYVKACIIRTFVIKTVSYNISKTLGNTQSNEITKYNLPLYFQFDRRYARVLSGVFIFRNGTAKSPDSFGDGTRKFAHQPGH